MAKTNKRAVEEGKEDLSVVTNDAPESKFQGRQQVANSTGFNVDSGKSSFIPEKKKAPGSTLKQEVAASVIKDASFGGSNSGDGMSFGGTRSSGSVGGILGAANATPVATQSRSDSRTSKKLDRNSQKLNYIPSDQVLVEWDESKPLADSSNEDQGFNGTYRNEFARTQKNQEAVPGALMFDRSVDLIVKDNIYFGQGQKVTQSGVTSNSDLVVTATPNASTGIYEYPSSPNYRGGTTGNYLNTSVDILFNSDGRPIYTVYNDVNLNTSVDQYEANKSSAQDHILMNDAELVRETMDSNAGDEKADKWSPLPRAIMQPTQALAFLRDLEAGVGNEIITAYRKACSSMSFQLNRAHKDGQDMKQPAIEALLGLNKNYVSKTAASLAGSDIADTFTVANYLNGEASTMIALYDSINKYNNKADLLIQPRSFRMHLQTADNNMDPLYTSKLFNQAYDVEEVFSTIDRDYDPMSPVCMTDKAAVVSRLSLHKMGSYIYNSIGFEVADKGNKTVDTFKLIPANMAEEITDHGFKVYIVYPKEASGNLSYDSSTGKIVASSTFEWDGGKYFGMYIGTQAPSYDSNDEALITITSLKSHSDLIFDGSGSSSHKATVTTATITPDAHKIYAYLGGPAAYKYNDLRNVYVVNVAHPLTQGIEDYFIESIGAKYFQLITDKDGLGVRPVHINTVHSTMFFSLWSFILCAATPWIVRARVNCLRDVLYYEKNYQYPFSSTLISIKEVLSKAYKNFGYSNYDTELTVGLMTPATSLTWMLPELCQQVGYNSGTSQVLMPWYTNQNAIRYLNGSYSWDDDSSAMSFPSIRSGVKLGSLDNLYSMTEKDVRLSLDMISSFKNLSPTLGSSHTYKYSAVGDGQLVLALDLTSLNIIDYLKLPRELGFFITAPYGTLTPNYLHNRDYTGSFVGTSSFRAYYWCGPNAVATDDQGTQSILALPTINVNRAQNFTQDWYCILASGTIPPVDHGFCLSASQAFTAAGALLLGRTSFTPYTTLSDNGSGVYSTNMNKMRSFQKFLWTRIQKLPFIISPFDGIVIDNSGSPNNVILNDPFDLCYIFGLGGFRASDYRESVYNREKEVVNQGLLFVSDPWIESSPIFKEGSVASGISVTKGFDL